MLLQHPVAGDHLGQIYERQGKKAEAIHAYQLALAVNSDLPETRERLEKLGGSTEDRPTLRRGGPASPRVSPEDELSELRTSPVPGAQVSAWNGRVLPAVFCVWNGRLAVHSRGRRSETGGECAREAAL